MKPQKFYEGKITRLDRKGRGVFDVTLPDGQTRPMFVPFTSPGDVIQTRYMGRKKGIYFGKLEKVIKAGPHRIDPPAPGLENYPGTPWLHIEYKTQLAYKRDMLNEAFKSQGHKERISEVEACPIIHHYRNRMDYTFGWRGELGLREYGFWHKYYNITHDILLCEEASEILNICRNLIPRFDLKPWDHKKLEGDLRYVVIRDIKSTGQRMIGLIVKDLSKINEPVREYLKTSLDKYATNILLGENPDITDVSTAQTTQILKGNPSVTEELNGVHYKMYLNSFFQTNSTTAARLLEIVGQYINNSNKSPTWVKRGLGALLHPVRINTSGTNPSNLPLRLINGRIFQILDLYCGLGFFG
ncbi:hypothetical protein KJ937_01525, partial [Patescibacteria group bacterium]|nr:hypothetical protein [Patescibacteria group bacterium]